MTSPHELTHHHHHDDDLAHDHPPSNSAEGVLPPSGQGTVVLDIGDGIGALVVHTTSVDAGREIELARVGEHTPFVHTDVRERILVDQTVYAGVFPQLDEGNYTLLDTERQPQANITITSGHVTNITLPH